MEDEIDIEGTIDGEPISLESSMPDIADITTSTLLGLARRGGSDAISEAIGTAAQRLNDKEDAVASFISAWPGLLIKNQGTD